MLTKETTFIIGAGASRDFDFPLGDDLRERIISVLAMADETKSLSFSDPVIWELLVDRATKERPGDWTSRIKEYRRAACIIRDGLPYDRSIDSFLDGLRNKPDVEFLGKLAIATVILRAESRSPLMPYLAGNANAEQIRAERLAKTVGGWHAQLGQILYAGYTSEDCDDVFSRSSFVIFNYDRCIEEFLAKSLVSRFDIERSRAEAAVARCRIVHPYGQVGEFQPGQEGHVAFGDADQRHLVATAASIRTFTEAMADDVAATVKEYVSRAETLVFMGFGWLPQNIQLLQAGGITKASKVFATTMKMDIGELSVVASKINAILNRSATARTSFGNLSPNPEFINHSGDCSSLMRNCWLRLTNG